MNTVGADHGSPAGAAATDALFPLWQIDRDEYAAVCGYLGVTPSERLHTRLNAHLAQLPFQQPPLEGFALHLAGPRLTRFRIARLDLATRLLFPAHPARHVLNAVIALHECDGRGFGELAAAPAGLAVWLALLVEGVRFALGALVAAVWLGLAAAAYAVRAPLRSRAELRGKRVLVTGAGRGLGCDVLAHCLESGASVVAVVRSAESRAELAALVPDAAPLGIVVADLAQPGALAAALNEAGVGPSSIDVAIACAGVKHAGTTALAESELRDTFAVNFFAAVELAGWLRGGAEATATTTTSPVALALVSSMGRWHGMLGSGGYNASKAALSIWGQSLEMDLQCAAGRPMTVTIVEPGLFASAMTAAAGPARWLMASRRELAQAIVAGALAGRRTLRRPLWFAWLTWAVCLAGRAFRARLFGRVKAETR